MRVLIVALAVMAVFFGYLVVSVVHSIEQSEVSAIHRVVAGFSK